MATTDYRTLVAEILEERCGTGALGEIFPSIGSSRLDVVAPRA
jgi:hypothetical protein